MKRRTWTVGLTVVVVLGAAVAATWPSVEYALGEVRAEDGLRAPLDPPEQDGDGWLVEPDVRLHVRTRGTGRPVLVLHGGPAVPYAHPWAGFEDLTGDYAFHYYDQRGCGASTRPFGRFDGSYLDNLERLTGTLGLGAQIADVERIRRILGEDRLLLVGHSYGGFLATLYAAEFPERVEKLLLVAPAGVVVPPEDGRDFFALVREELNAENRAAFDATFAEYFDFGGVFERSEAELAQLHADVGAHLLRAMGYTPEVDARAIGGWAVQAMYFTAGAGLDHRDALAAVRAPTLILHGADDPLGESGARSYLAIEGSGFELVEGDAGARAGHFLFDDSPESFAAAAAPFLRGDR